MEHIYNGAEDVFVTHVVPDEGSIFEITLTDGSMSAGKIAVRAGVELPIKSGVLYPSGIGYANGGHSSGGGAIYTRLVTYFKEVVLKS